MRGLFPALCILTLVISACQPKNEKHQGDFTVQVNLKGVDTLIFERIEAEELRLVDTIFTEEGEFTATDTLNGSGFFLLRTPKGDGINLLIEEGEAVSITGDSTDWVENIQIKGSIGSALTSELQKKLIDFETKIDLIYEEAKYAQKEDFITLQNRFNANLEEHTDYLKSVIDSNPESKISVLALFQTLKGETILNIYEDFDYYEKVEKQFQLKWPESSHSKILSEITKTAFAPNFTMNDINGDSFSLSQFDGKVVLLDFWASWCRPCRLANPKVVELYHKYNAKGLEIVGISLDGNPRQKNPAEDWVNAVKEDQLPWTHVSDLKGWETEIRNSYDFRSIPHTVLLDTNRRILGENLSFEILDRKIAERLNP